MIGDEIIRKKLGELVSDENADNWWRPELFEKYTRSQIPTTLEILTPPPPKEQNYNCFVYVLNFQNDANFLGNKGWEFTRNLGPVFDEMIRNKILKAVAVPAAGNMIVYRGDNNFISHVGLMENDEVVVSKWSWGPLLKHAIFDVPDHYGNKVEFYTFSSEARDFISKKYSKQDL